MAKIKELSVSVCFTKNLGNYQSLKLDAGLTVSLEEGDDYDKEFQKAWDIASEQISDQLELFEDKKQVKKGL